MPGLNLIKRFLFKEDGPTATEYAIMLAVIIIVAFAAISSLGTNTVGGTFTKLAESFGDLGQ